MLEFLSLLLIENAGTILLAVIAAVFAWLAKKKWISEELLSKFQNDVSGVVTEVYHEYVQSIKSSREDGKLTDEEKKIARELAITKLKEIGKEKGVDYIKTFGVPLITSLIEKYVQINKK